MKKNIIALVMTAMVLAVIFYIIQRIPGRDDRILIDDLWKSKEILITLPEYDFIRFAIELRNTSQKYELKNFKLTIKQLDDKIVFSTNKYDIGSRILFWPCFFSDPNTTPPRLGDDVMTVFLEPKVQLKLEINYQEKDNHNIFQKASLFMIASYKYKNVSSLKDFSVSEYNLSAPLKDQEVLMLKKIDNLRK